GLYRPPSYIEEVTRRLRQPPTRFPSCVRRVGVVSRTCPSTPHSALRIPHSALGHSAITASSALHRAIADWRSVAARRRDPPRSATAPPRFPSAPPPCSAHPANANAAARRCRAT